MGHWSLAGGAAALFIASSALAQTVVSESFEEFPSGVLLNGLVSDDSEWNAYPNWSVTEPSVSGCFADLNPDFVVDGGDLAGLLANWAGSDVAADLNGDGVVDGADLAQLLAAWGDCSGQAGGQSLTAAPGNKIPVTNGTLIFDELATVPADGAITIEMDVFITPPGRTLRFVPQAFGLAPTSTHLFVLAASDVVNFRVGAYVTAKRVAHGEWFSIQYVLTSEPGGDVSLRVSVKDSETTTTFGSGFVEIFPGGPFGPALHGATLAEAPAPFPVPLTTLNGIDFAVDEDFSAPDPIYVDEISVQVDGR